MTAFIQSSPGLGARLSALDGWSAGEGPLLHSHLFGQTIKHLHTALTQAGLPQNIPSLAQGLGLSDGKEYGRGAGAVPGEARQAQAPEKVSNLGSHPGLWHCPRPATSLRASVPSSVKWDVMLTQEE